MVSHDLKNPIGLVMTYSEMIKAQGLIENEKGQRYLERISAGAEKMLNLVTDLLDLARIEEGMALQPELTDVDEFMQSIEEDFKVLAQQKDIFWAYKPLLEPIRLKLDRDRFGQVMTNLFANAIKYTSSGGEVNISADKQDDSVLIKVADTGRGIPVDDVPHLFEKFYRVQSADNDEFEGTGLGLAISKAIVEQHGGKIWAESTIKKGSTFFVEIPRDS